MEIEEVAARTPEKILKEYIHPAVGLAPYQARRMALGLDMTKDEQKQAVKVFTALVNCAIQTDASMLEINPLVVTEQGQVLALDAKMNFDDNAMFRHKDLHEYRDLDEEAPEEVTAKNYDLNYIKLDGNIACMVNGAGLAMATMDCIKLHGGDPANFLDAGGSANEETVTEAFKIIINDPSVKSILVNIFGGIMKCDVIAQGVINAAKTLSLNVPLIVRLEGTNVDAGRKLLEESGLNIEFASGMDEAAGKAVAATKA
jgi:succinyl-CoA synthetase beta subunit